ncbi:hypothetical protein ACFQPG_07965 [Sphingomonas sp. GCM10030256]|uniref:hypothetical protein n=1 Tax=Sphingomonas sp. GCM10030256 TaxID=3273427 RepID=UPI00360F92FF
MDRASGHGHIRWRSGSAALGNAVREPEIDAKRVTVPPLLKRLTVREYLPLALSVAAWVMIGLAVGHADAVRLLAANTLAQGARALCTMELNPVLKARIWAADEVFRASRRTAIRIELVGLAASVLIILLTAGLLEWRGYTVAAAMMVILTLGIPARHPLSVSVIKRERVAPWRFGAALTGAIGTAIVLLLGLPWWAAALAFGLREWGGLLTALLIAPPRRQTVETVEEPLTFAEVAGQTESTARRRLTYRIGKSMLGAVLGPLGSVAARTGREVRIDHKISRYIPRHRPGFILFTAATLGAGLFFIWVSREPATLLLGAALTRVAASGGSALLWWNYASASFDEEEDDEG